jgi:hypothetical protein
MTWLGKIFALFVFVLALANVWFITTVWVTRTNWKTQRDAYEKAYKDSLAARQAEYDAYRTEIEARNGSITTLKTEVASALKAKEEAEQENRNNKETFAAYQLKYTELSKKITDLQTKIEAHQAINDEALRRANVLEAAVAELTVGKNVADRERIAAESGRRRAEGIADQLARQTEDLRNLVAELRNAGPGGGLPKGGYGQGAPVVPEALRGTVTHVQDKDPATGIQGELVQISLGIDAGLQRGAVLQIERPSEGKYLGTIVIDTVYPKYAVAVFHPAGGKALRRLKPDEFPKVNDVVRVPDNRASTVGANR